MLKPDVQTGEPSLFGGANYNLALPVLEHTPSLIDTPISEDYSQERFIDALDRSPIAQTVKERVHEILSKQPPSTKYDSHLIKHLTSDSLVERAIAIGHIKKGAPEIVYASRERQELFELERNKIAMRSMEHAQAGRAFNDFRAQLAICVSSLQGGPQYPMPPGARVLNIVASIFGLVLFDTFHQHIEKPYVFIPAAESNEPTDFSHGVALLKEILPSVSLLERSVRELYEIANSEEIKDIDPRVVTSLSQAMLSDLEKIKNNFDLSESSDKFRPSSVEFNAFAANETVQWTQEAVTDKSMRSELLGYVESVCTYYGDLLNVRAQRLAAGDLLDPRATALLNESNTAKDTFYSIKDKVREVNRSEVPDHPAECTLEDLEILKWQILEAAPKSALAREIALDRIQLASGEIELDEVNLSQIIASLPGEVLPMPGKETLKIRIPEDKTIFVIGNERRLKGALSNIINNAFHYGDTLTISLSYDQKKKQAVIELADNGKGVAQELLDAGALPNRPRIFDLGVTKREHDSADKKKGTGVGTTESYYLLEMHDGTLDVKSRRAPLKNHGTKFTARLRATAEPMSNQGKTLSQFEELFDQKVGEISGDIFEEVIDELPENITASLSDIKINLRSEGDPFNQDFIAFSRQNNGNKVHSNEIFISEDLLRMKDHVALKLILRDFLLPFEVEASNQAIVKENDPLVRHGALMLRMMERFRGLMSISQIGLIEALQNADLHSSTGRRLAADLKASLEEDLPARAIRALNWAATNQLRPLVLRDPISLNRDIIELSGRAGPIAPVAGAASMSRKDISIRFEELCRVFDIHPGTALYRLVQESVIEDKEVPLKPYHRMRYPTDARSMLVYLTEHGLLTSVLRKLKPEDITRWRDLSEEVLPLAARVLLPGSDEIFEGLLQRSGNDKWARNLATSLAQLPLLGAKNLDRMQEVGEFLKSQNVQPLTSEEVSQQEAAAVSDWVAMLDKTAALISDSGLDEVIYSLEDSKQSQALLHQVSTVNQFRHIRSTLEAREVFPFVTSILEYFAENRSAVPQTLVNAQSAFKMKTLIERAESLKQYFSAQQLLDASPAHDPIVKKEISKILELVSLIANSVN